MLTSHTALPYKQNDSSLLEAFLSVSSFISLSQNIKPSWPINIQQKSQRDTETNKSSKDMAIPGEDSGRAGLNPRICRQYLIAMIGELRPSALRIILEMDLGFDDMDAIRQYIKNLVNTSCHTFITHARKWVTDPDFRPLEIMDEYHSLWEGFHSAEPYHNSQGQKIKYFMDINRGKREREMNAQFVTRR